jgi:hydrogenase maturation protein HypF
MECLNIAIKGVVQGVGFRPFVFNLANQLSVRGFVTNTSDGVIINAEGDNLDPFVARLRSEAPPLSGIVSMESVPCEFVGYGDFTIRESTEEGSFTLVSPDVSICDECLRELFEEKDRRYLYPFINCTNCGPRYSITRSVPYDRKNTTMDVFRMCDECASEYGDPRDRRFHAQPDACARCGPVVTLSGTDVIGADPVSEAIGLLKQGRIVAVKGLGGFHLACDALNREAVAGLRDRKRRNNKPFGLMAPDVGTVRNFCHVSPPEEALLRSSRRPIVLLRKKEGADLPEAIAPHNGYLGFMLPYTPLHYLLFYHPCGDAEAPRKAHFSALVMTSGNMSEEPIVTGNDEAMSKLAVIADAFLVHNRDIFMRVDDSVLRIAVSKTAAGVESAGEAGQTDVNPGRSYLSFVRRSRGYVPDPILLDHDGPEVLGCGADVKNTFTLTKGRFAIPSQHIGDMENFETLNFFEETLANMKAVYRADPKVLVHDLHPGYLSTRWALARGEEGFGTFGVQHHYAHIGSVMAEKGIREKVIGVSFDGTGYGTDGSLWGGEFLIADISGFERAAHLDYIPLPGGEMAIKEPWRISLSCLKEAAGDEIWRYLGPTGFVEKYGRKNIENILRISGVKSFSPLSSGAGRLFDAVSALLGICDSNTFEGEAAIALESIAEEGVHDDYPVDVRFQAPIRIDFSMAILGMISDMQRGEKNGVISAKFHNSVVSSIARVVGTLSSMHNISKVVLSGGVFQNLYLLSRLLDELRGLEVHINELVPCNDAGISLGQAYIMRERMRK